MLKITSCKRVLLLCVVITMSGCCGNIPCISSCKPKYAYLDIVTTPSKAFVYVKTLASTDMNGVSLFPIDVDMSGYENPEWTLIGTTPINKHKIIHEAYATLVSLFACVSLDMDVSIDIKIEKKGYKSILLNNVSLRNNECTHLDIDLIQTE